MSNKNDIAGANTYHLLVLLDIFFGDSDVNEWDILTVQHAVVSG